MSIALIITVYNRERYLAAAIFSVLAQTRTDFELLIWDDGSSDGSVEIARTYEGQDKRVRVVAADYQGFSLTLEKAISQTQGVYLGWVDSDGQSGSDGIKRDDGGFGESARCGDGLYGLFSD